MHDDDDVYMHACMHTDIYIERDIYSFFGMNHECKNIWINFVIDSSFQDKVWCAIIGGLAVPTSL